MIKSIVVHDIPLDAYPAMERWYSPGALAGDLSSLRSLADPARELSAYAGAGRRPSLRLL